MSGGRRAEEVKRGAWHRDLCLSSANAFRFHLFPHPFCLLPARAATATHPEVATEGASLDPVRCTSCPKASVCSSRCTNARSFPWLCPQSSQHKGLDPPRGLWALHSLSTTASLGISPTPPPAKGPLHIQFPAWNTLSFLCPLDS